MMETLHDIDLDSNSLMSSGCQNPRLQIYLLAKVISDQRTITRKNVHKVQIETGSTDLLNVNTSKLKQNIKFCEIPDGMQWKIETVKELTNVRQNELNVVFDNEDLLTTKEIDIILNLVTSE